MLSKTKSAIIPARDPSVGGWEDNDRRMYDNVDDEDDIVDTLFGENNKLFTFASLCVLLRVLCRTFAFFCVRFVSGFEHFTINKLQYLRGKLQGLPEARPIADRFRQ